MTDGPPAPPVEAGGSASSAGPTPGPGPDVIRLRLDLAYDGSAFSGWAAQPGRRSVQGVLEDALATVLRVPQVRVVCAGRTDAGVHARGQAAHADVPAPAWEALRRGRPRRRDTAATEDTGPPTSDGSLPSDVLLATTGAQAPDRRVSTSAAQAIDAHVPTAGAESTDRQNPVDGDEAAAARRPLRRLAGVLPPDVTVRSIGPAPVGFDARFSVLSRAYVYRLDDDPTGPDPLTRGFVVHHRSALDVSTMQEASGDLLGLRDFAAFCKHREGATTIRSLLRLDWARSGHRIDAYVEADAFCHSMVRALVGALLMVGDGRRPATWPAEVLGGRSRVAGAEVAPPHGLVLDHVRYPSDADLQTQADRARRVRTLEDLG